MGYVDKSRAEGERVLSRGRFPTVFWIGAWLVLLVAGPLIIGVVLFARWATRMLTTEFAVTNDRVLLKQGWVSRVTDELAVETVEKVEVAQGLMGRLFGFGRVTVRGTGEATIVFPPMQDPISFRRAIENARR